MSIEDIATHRSIAPLKVLVVGASGGTGRAAVQQLLKEGHQVTAFSRQASKQFTADENLIPFDGDALNNADVEHAVQGQDVVIVVLGISENPLRVRLFGSAGTADKVRSVGTQNVVGAMLKHGVNKLVVQSSYGVGESQGRLGFMNQLFFDVILKPQIEDTEIQEQLVRDSGLDWLLVQPVHLVDNSTSKTPHISTTGHTRKMTVSRNAVAQFLAGTVSNANYIGKTVAISG